MTPSDQPDARGREVGQAATDGNGIFDIRVAVAAELDASVRFVWLPPDATWQTSPAVAPVAFPVP